NEETELVSAARFLPVPVGDAPQRDLAAKVGSEAVRDHAIVEWVAESEEARLGMILEPCLIEDDLLQLFRVKPPAAEFIGYEETEAAVLVILEPPTAVFEISLDERFDIGRLVVW